MNKACYYTPSVECLVLTAASTVVFHEFESKKIVCWMKKKNEILHIDFASFIDSIEWDLSLAALVESIIQLDSLNFLLVPILNQWLR